MLAINVESISRALRPVAAPLSWLGLAAIIGAALFFTSTTPYPGIAVALPVLGAALVLAAGLTAPRRGAEAVLGLRPFQYVGRTPTPGTSGTGRCSSSCPPSLVTPPRPERSCSPSSDPLSSPQCRTRWWNNHCARTRICTLYPCQGLLLGAGLIGVSVLSAVMVMALVVVPAATGTPVSQTASVTRNVALATELRLLPSNTFPPLGAVPGDSPSTCLATSRAHSLVTCTLGDVRATRTVALFGDSHVWQWTPPIAALAAKRGWKLVTYAKGACPIDADNFTAISHFYNFPTYTGNWASTASTGSLPPSPVWPRYGPPS